MSVLIAGLICLAAGVTCVIIGILLLRARFDRED